MHKEIKDGLEMDQSFYIIDEKKPGFPVSSRVIQVLAILIASWGFLSVLVECLSIPVNLIQVNAAILIFTGIMFAFCVFTSYDLVKLFFGILFYGLFFYSRLPKLANGFYIIENQAIDRMTAYYNYQSLNFIADYTRATQDTTLLVIMVMIPVISLFTIAIVRNRFIGIGSLVLFLPVFASFLVGMIPSERYLVAYVAAVLYLARSGVPNRSMTNKEQRTLLHRINSRAAVWLSLIGLFIFFLLKLFVSEKNYNNMSEIKDIKNDVQTAFMDFSSGDFTSKFSDIKLFQSDKLSIGGLCGGKLGSTGLVEFADTEQLVVTLPLESGREGIYLKGYVGTEYTGSSWEKHTKKDREKYYDLKNKLTQFTPVNQNFLLLNAVLGTQTEQTTIITDTNPDGIDAFFIPLATEYQIFRGKCTVEYKEANKKFIYAPYFTDFSILDETYDEQDLYCAPVKKRKSYEFDYYFNLYLGYSSYNMLSNIEGQLGNYPEEEKLYRDYVYEVYTKLPDKGLDRLKEDFSEDKLPSQTMGITDKIAYVQNYLEENTQYTLSPGKLPKDKDFVEYFLYENKQGYCAHYASAATLMLRAMGVPARYVEGYAVGPDQAAQEELDGSQTITSYNGNGITLYDTKLMTISVKDYNAHAWVEVYIDGCGWLPVDVTPGSAIATDSSMLEGLSQVNDFLNQDKKFKATPTPLPVKPTHAAAEDEINKRTMNQDNGNLPSPTAVPLKRTQEKVDRAFTIAFILLPIVAVGLFLLAKLSNRNQRINSRNPNKRAIYSFMETEMILSFCHELPGKGTKLEDCGEYIKKHCRYIDSGRFDSFFEIVKRARFGQYKITWNELDEVENFNRQLYDKVYGELPIVKKLSLKFLLFLQN